MLLSSRTIIPFDRFLFLPWNNSVPVRFRNIFLHGLLSSVFRRFISRYVNFSFRVSQVRARGKGDWWFDSARGFLSTPEIALLKGSKLGCRYVCVAHVKTAWMKNTIDRSTLGGSRDIASSLYIVTSILGYIQDRPDISKAGWLRSSVWIRLCIRALLFQEEQAPLLLFPFPR